MAKRLAVLLATLVVALASAASSQHSTGYVWKGSKLSTEDLKADAAFPTPLVGNGSNPVPADDPNAYSPRSGMKKPGHVSGFICCAIAILFFGSNFIVTKKFESGDGMFFQIAMTTAVWFTGMIMLFIMGVHKRTNPVDMSTYYQIPAFYPWGALGGVLWATGNVFTVVAIKLCGLSIGLCVWSSTNMLMGWSTGTFGLFGTSVNKVQFGWLNYIGVALALCALVMYIFVKVEDSVKVEDGAADIIDASDGSTRSGEGISMPLVSGDMAEPLVRGSMNSEDGSGASLGGSGVATREMKKAKLMDGIKNNTLNYLDSESFTEAESTDTMFAYALATEIKYDVLPDELAGPFDFLERQNPIVRKVFGVLLAMVMGLFYGSTFTPVAYNINVNPDVSDNYLDFVFSHYCGILITSIGWWLLYCAVMCNRPRIYPKLVLPAFISGLMWGVAQTAWFVANGALGFAVAFPMITSGPGLLASFWGIVLFKEIKGTRNFIFLGLALCFTVSSGICIGISKGNAP